HSIIRIIAVDQSDHKQFPRHQLYIKIALDELDRFSRFSFIVIYSRLGQFVLDVGYSLFKFLTRRDFALLYLVQVIKDIALADVTPHLHHHHLRHHRICLLFIVLALVLLRPAQRPVDQQHFRVLPDNHAGTLNHGLRVRPDHHHNHSLHLIAIIIDSRDISSLQSKLTEYLQHLSVDLDQFAHAVVLLVAPLIGSVLILRSHSALFDVFNQSVLYVPQGHVVVDEVK